MKYILASASPRRSEILKTIIDDFDVMQLDIEEKEYKNLSPEEAALQISKDKCIYAKKLLKDEKAVIITGDTVVDVDGRIFTKPEDGKQAYKMLSILSGRQHLVHSGVSVAFNGKIYSFSQTTKVYFDNIDNESLVEYINTQEPYDKAGGYAIQGFMARYILKIDGSYHNVVGLPVQKLYKLLKTIKAI